MFSFTLLFVIAAAISTAYGDTDSLKEYYLLSQQEFLHDIALVNVQIAEADARILERTEVNTYDREQFVNEMQVVNQTYLQLQALSPAYEYCIQKYGANFIAYDMAGNQLARCRIEGISHTSAAKSYRDSANNLATTMLHNYITTCDDFSEGSEELLASCYVRSITFVSESLKEQLDNAKDSLERALFDTAQGSKLTINCTFKIGKNILENIGKTIMSIETCVACFENGSLTAEC